MALRPLGLGEIFNGAFNYVRQNPKATLGLAAIVMAVAGILPSIGLTLMFQDMGTMLSAELANPGSTGDSIPYSGASLATTYGGAAVQAVAQLLLSGLLTMIVGRAVLGQRMSMRDAWQAAKSRLPAVFGVTGLIFLGLCVWTALFTGVLIGGILLSMRMPLLGIPLLIAGVAALAVLGIWLYVRFALAVPAVVLERMGPATALGRSWQLIRGSWWRVFAILLLSFLVVMLVSQVLSTPFSIIGLVAMFFGGDSWWAPVVGGAGTYLGTIITSALTAPFNVGVVALLYIDLRMRREGLDLRLQAAAHSGEELGPDVFSTADTGAPA